MNKVFIYITALTLICESTLAGNQNFSGFEKGQTSTSFFAGQPTFFRYNKFLGWKRAWSVDGGYHFDKYPYLAANYTVYFYSIRDRLKNDGEFFNSLSYYAGPGVFVGPDFDEEDSDKKMKFGIRAFAGSEYIFRNTPWSINIEIGPALYIEGEDDKLGFQGMMGVTYYIGGIKTRKLKSKISNIREEKEIKVKSKPQKDEFDEFED